MILIWALNYSRIAQKPTQLTGVAIVIVINGNRIISYWQGAPGRNSLTILGNSARWGHGADLLGKVNSLNYRDITSSTAQGGGGSFKNRKPIGEVGCCESGMAERSHWWTERCLRSPLFLSLSLTIYLPTYLSSMYLSNYRLSIYLSISLSLFHLITYLSICLSIYLSVYLSICLSIYLSFICLSV